MDEVFAALLGWAVALSGYPMPNKPPQVVREPHAFFVAHACGGRECKVWGWFAGGERIYVDERLDPSDNLLGASIVVHEMTHYLQANAGKLSDRTSVAASGPAAIRIVNCELTIDLEREAYGVQQAFLVRYGVYQPVGVSMHNVGCGEEAARQTRLHKEPPLERQLSVAVPF